MATLIADSFSATGQSKAVEINPKKDVVVTIGRTGTTMSGTVRIERSYDDETSWTVVSVDASGTAASYTADATVVLTESEVGTQYRLNCTAFSSGPIYYRIGQ